MILSNLIQNKNVTFTLNSLCSLEIPMPCASNPCVNGATCFDQGNRASYVCLCPAGFEGTNCENGMYNLFKLIFIQHVKMIYDEEICNAILNLTFLLLVK